MKKTQEEKKPKNKTQKKTMKPTTSNLSIKKNQKIFGQLLTAPATTLANH
jgi:hypothetical protein